MGDIFVKCPRTLKSVPTGLKAEWVVLHSLPTIAIPLICAACGQTHRWTREDAWIGGETSHDVAQESASAS